MPDSFFHFLQKQARKLALGGNYGSFGWVGFDNDDLTLEANEEIPLLGSVTSNPWTYEDVATGVGQFICGVAHLNESLDGATFTVMLRLTNPEDENEYYNVNTVEYTFRKLSDIDTAKELAAALNAGEDVTLAADINMTDAPITIPKGADVTLNLNGHTISGKATNSGTSNLIKVSGGAALTLTGNGTITFYATNPDTEWGGEGQPPFPGYASNTIKNEGKLIVDGVTIENKTGRGGASYAIDNYQGSELIVNSGKVIQSGNDVAIRMFANSYTADVKVTINGGTIEGRRAIWVHIPGSDSSKAQMASLTINGGTLTSTDPDGDYLAIYSYSYGCSFAETYVTITGGTFNGNVAFGGGYKGDRETVTITGGTFNGALGRYLANDGWEDIAKPTN